MQIRCFQSRLFRWEHPDSERGDSYDHFDTTLALPWGVHVGPRWPTHYNDTLHLSSRQLYTQLQPHLEYAIFQQNKITKTLHDTLQISHKQSQMIYRDQADEICHTSLQKKIIICNKVIDEYHVILEYVKCIELRKMYLI